MLSSFSIEHWEKIEENVKRRHKFYSKKTLKYLFKCKCISSTKEVKVITISQY